MSADKAMSGSITQRKEIFFGCIASFHRFVGIYARTNLVKPMKRERRSQKHFPGIVPDSNAGRPLTSSVNRFERPSHVKSDCRKLTRGVVKEFGPILITAL